jgi:YidC/Oxa1 family membrane protein insertase
VLDPLYRAIAFIVVAIHGALAPVFGTGSGWSWGLAIVFLTMLMRLLLFPLFVKQIKTQRKMQLMQPKIKELQAKYKGDRESMNAELMKLYKAEGANPLLGCLPLLLQMPVFFALFHVLNGIKPDADGKFHAHSGISADLVSSAAHAKVFGAPIAARFQSSASDLLAYTASPTTVKVVCAIMIVLMGASTFWTQRQMFARTGSEMPSQQKTLLYVLPLTFLFFGINFPVGVLLYWLTTNLWSMGQQHFVIAKMGAYGPVKPAVAGAAAAGGAAAIVPPPAQIRRTPPPARNKKRGGKGRGRR